MGRRKIEIKAIKDDRNRSVTFLKRKGGLFKKAHELSVLTSVDVAVIIFGQNNKLYEYSSTSNLPDFLQRYQYARNAYGGPHELKGPDDFKDKRDGGDDDDDDDDIGDLHGSPSPPQAMMPQHGLPPHQQQFQGLGGTPSASPPMPNGAFHHHHPHHGTPQPISRPTSRAHVRHPSQSLPPNMPPGQHLHHQAAAQQPSYAYQPNPPIYNPQAAAAMQARSQPPPPQYQNYTSVPQSHQATHQQQQSVQQHMYQQEPPRPVPASQIPTSQPQQPQQPQQQELKPPQIHVPSPEPAQNQFNSPPLPQPKPLPASKTHSIFTPIEDSRSVLLRHWGGTETKSDPLKTDPSKADQARSQSLDVGSMKRNQMNGVIPNGKPSHAPTSIPPQRTSSSPAMSSVPQMPPTRSNSLAKPKLKVQIPADDADDAESGKGGETSSDNRNIATANNILTPIREPGLTPGPVLPPPSPSASALLSAGATGPPNPFARPLPPSTNGTGGGSGANSTRELDTPISALPSRFMENGLLPSPSSFYPDWPFGGRDSGSGGGNMLPSPLTFQTPVNTHGPSFRDDDPGSSGKRKLDAQATEGPNQGKRIKT